VLKILEENKETISVNKSLEEQSQKLIKLTSDLKLANEELKIQDQLKDDFLDTVAHELKTPITSIKASSEVLSEKRGYAVGASAKIFGQYHSRYGAFECAD